MEEKNPLSNNKENIVFNNIYENDNDDGILSEKIENMEQFYTWYNQLGEKNIEYQKYKYLIIFF